MCLGILNSTDILISLVSSFPPGWGRRSGVVLSCGGIGFFVQVVCLGFSFTIRGVVILVLVVIIAHVEDISKQPAT